ncbi:mucin-17-like [Arvicola amphibius]|uniref:mucin-17-like n=1 Tax=Arvicola amphibius TaxID=1047088 RepID=UPI001C0A1E59|nr:mucin-17-like [Arvicola amphibius]
MSWSLTVGTRSPSILDSNEEERVQGALLIQKAWMFALLVHAEPPAATVQDWPVQARGRAFQEQLSSFVRFLRPTITRVLSASPTGRVHISREGAPLSEAIALLLLAASHHWCQKPYEDKTFKIPNTGTADRLQSLRAIIKTTSSKKTLDPLKELKEIKEGQVPLPPEVPDCRSNPLSREPRPSALPPATRKRVASTSVHRPWKVQRSLDMSTVFKEPMDFDHWSTRVSATSPRTCAGDASEKVNEDDTVPGPSSANSFIDQRGLVISPHFQVSLQSSSPIQGGLGSSTSSQDAQGLCRSTQEVLGETHCDQGSMGHYISSQASQKPPPCDERKIKHVSLSRRGFRSPSSSQGVINHSSSPPKSFRQAPSDQGGLHKAPLGKERSKCVSTKWVLSDFSFSQNGMCPTLSPQGSLTPLTAAKDGWRDIPSHEESQGYFPSPQNDPKQSIAAEVSLSPASSDQGNFITSPLKQEGFKCPPPENGLRSSLTAQGEPSPMTTPQLSLTPLMPTQAETKLSTSTSGIQEPLPSSEGALESSTCLQEMLGTPKSTQGTFLPSQHTQRSLAPASTSLGVLSPPVSVKRTPELSTSREEGQRPILSHKEKFKPNPNMKMDSGYCHCSKKRRTDPPSEQGGFPVSLSYQEGFKYTRPTKKALLIHHQKQNSQRYAKRAQVSHARSTTTQGTKTIQPSLLPQGSLGLSTCVGEALEISTYTPGLTGHLQPAQHFLGPTICDKGTVGQDTSAEEVPDSSQSLEMALGCHTCTQEFVANFTLREGDSLDSTCPQTPVGPLHSLQEAVEISPSPQGYQQSVTTTQKAIGYSPSAQRDVSLSTCPQVTQEHPTNTPKVLNSTLSSQGPLESVLSIQLSLEPNVSIQKSLSSSLPEESIPETCTFTQGAPVTSLTAHEDFRPTTYAQETLGDTTPTQVLETSPHSEAVVKQHTCTPDTVALSPSEQEALGSTISEEGTLPSSPSTQESFMHIPSQEGIIKHPSSTQVYPGHSISTKKRLRDDPSDEGDFGTSSSEEGSFIFFPSSKRIYVSLTALKETLITTSTPQVSPMPSISVQKALQCSSSEQKTVEPCHSNQGPHGHSISSQEAQGPSLSVPKGLCYLPSVPGLQGHSPSLSKAPENSTYTQGDLSISKSELGDLKSSLSAKGSKGKAKCKQKHLEPLPLAQEDLILPTSSKPSKDPHSSSCLLAAEHFPSPSGSPVPSTSKQWYLGTSPSCQRFLGHSSSAPGALCCFQAAHGAKELLSSAQEPQESFLPSLSYSEHLPNLPGDQEDSSLEQEILENVFPAQGSLETLCSPGVSLQRPLLSLQRPLELFIPTQESAGTLPSTQKALGSLLSLSGKVGTSQSAQGLQRFLLSTHEYLENSSSAFVPLEHLPVAPKARGLSTLSQENPSPSLPVHGILELPQNGSVALPSKPYIQGLQGSLSSSEGSIAPVLSVQGSVGHSLSVQEPIEISKSTKATPGHSLFALDDMSPFMSFQGTLGQLSSVEVDVGTYSHNTGSPGQLKNIPEYMITDQDSVVIFSPAQGTLRHLPFAQGDVGLPLFAQQAPELSTCGAAKVALVNPSSPKGATAHFQCAQYALEHLPPSKGALEYSSTHQGTQGSLKSSQEALEILSSNSEHVKNSLSVTGGLESSPPGPRVLEHMLADKQPEQLSISTQGSLGNSLSTQEAQEHFAPSMGNLKPCQYTKEELKTLIPSQIVLESVPSISEDLGALSSALEHMGLSSLVNESLENSQSAESVVESSSATGALRATLFVQQSLENSLPGKGIRETLSSSQGALEIFSPTKGRVENVSSPERSVKPPISLQEASRSSPLIHGPHQGPLGPSQTNSGIQGPLSTPEAGGNLSRELGTWKSCPLIPETLDHLQSTEGPDDLSISAHGMFDPLPSTQGTLGLLVYSPGLMELSESEHKKLEPVSYVGKDGEISPFEKPAKSTSPLAPYLPFVTEVLESSSCGLGSLGSFLSSREDAKGTPSAPHAQKPSSSTSQALEHSVTTQGPLQINTPDEQTLCPLPSTVDDIEHSIFSRGFPRGSQILPNVPDHLSSIGESEEFSRSAPGTKDILLLAPEPLEHSSLQNATQATSPCLQEVVGSLISEQGSLGRSPSAHGSLEPLASTLGAEGPSVSEADTIQLSASAPVTKAHLTSSLGPSASKYYDQMEVPSRHGDLEASQSDQRTLEMTKFAEGALENLSVAQRTTKLSTRSQKANTSSLSDQGHLLHLPHVKEALIPALSDQETEESLLSPSEDTQHPPSSASAQIQEPSLSTLGPQEPLKLSISVCDSLCPFPSSLESETVELSTSSPECLEPSQSAQGEPEYFSTVGKTIEHSSTASQTTRKLSSPQECGGHLSSAPSVQELFQSGPVNLATFLSPQGPQKPFKLTQGLLHPPASAQESQGPSESSQDVVGTHESSRIHEYFLPEVESVETFTSVSGTIVTSPSALQALELSSLQHVTSAISLTDQRVVGPRPPSQGALEVLSLAEGTLETLASSQGDGRNSQLEKDTVEQSFPVQGILKSLPRTTGVLRSNLYAHKVPEILTSTQKDYLSPKCSLVLPISANRTLENLQSDHELTKHSNSFQEASRHSLFVQDPLQDSPSASETLRPSSNQGIKKSLLSSPGAMKPSSSAPDGNKSLQTTLRNRPTRLCNQGHWENSMSLQGTLGSFSSRSGSVKCSASSPLILGSPASFQSKPEHLFCTDTSPSFQGPTEPLSFPSGTTEHLQHGTRSHASSLSACKDLAHFLSDQLYISTQGTLASSPYSPKSLQQSESSQEMLGPSKFDECTHSHMSSVPDNLGMSPFVPMITDTLPQTTMTPGFSSLTQTSPVPSLSLQKDDECCLSSQVTLEVNTSGQDTLKPSPTTQVPEKASLYRKPTLVKPTGAQSTEGHPTSKSGTNQSTQKELGVSSPAQRQLVISLSTQGTLQSCSSDQGPLGTSLSVQGSLKLSTLAQGTVGTLDPSKRALKHPISSQESPKFYSSAQDTVQSSASSPRTTGSFQSSQKPRGSFSSSLAHIEHSPPAPGAQENPLSNPRTLDPLLSSKVPKELSTATEEMLPVLSSLSSIQRPSKHSGVLRQHQHSQNTLQHLSCVREGVETSQSATRTIEVLPPPLMARGHLTSIQESAESFPSGQGNLEPLKPAQGPLKHVMASQEMLHSAQFAEGTLQISAPFQAVPQPYTNSLSTQVTRGAFSSVSGHPGLLSSAQATPLSSCSDEKTVGTCPSSQGTLKMSKSAQGTLESSSDSHVTGEFLLSAKGTMGNLTSVKQTVGPFTSMTGPLRSIQNTQALLGSLQSGQSSLQVSQAAEGPVDPSLFSQESLDLSVSAQGTPVTLLCNQGTTKHPASSQTSQKTSQSVKNSLQHPPSVPGFLNPSQSEKSKLGSLSSPPGAGISVPGSQEIFQLSVHSGYSEPLLYFGLPLKLSVCAQGTLCPFSSPQGELNTLHCVSGNLATSQSDQVNFSHLSSVREPVGNLPTFSGPREPSPINEVPRRLSSHVPGDPASLISAHLPLELKVSAQCSLSPSASSKGTLGSLLSSADIQGKVQNTHNYHGQLSHIRETLETSPTHRGISVYQPHPQETLGLYSLGQGSQATSQCAQETVGSHPSTQESMGLSTSAQRSLGHHLPAQGLSGFSSHTQCTCSQSTSTQTTVAYSSSTPVSQGYSQHAKKIVETLNSAPGSPRISVTAQGSVEPLLSPQKSPGYSLSIPSTCKTSTGTRGHVVSDYGPLELSISAQANLSPFHSSQCLLEPSLSVEGNFGLSTPMQANLEPTVSSQGPLGSWQSSQRVQQTDTSASDSLGSMSSKGQMVISLSGQGTLGPTSVSLEPLEISLSVQVSSRPLLSLQVAGGTCLSSQGRKTQEVSTCAHGNLVLSNSSRGDLGSSSSTPVTLGSSPPAKVDLGMSPSVSWTLRPPVSSQGVLGTSTSAQEVSSASQGKTEPMPYAQDDMGLGSLSLGTEGNSQFSKGELKVLSSAQGCFKPALSTPGPVEKLPYASRTPQLFSSVLQDAGSFPLSSQNNLKLSRSSQKHLESSPTPQMSLKHSPSSQKSLIPTPSEPGTLEHSLRYQGWQKVSAPAKVTPGQTPYQKVYEGNSLSAQGTVRLPISGQESLGHCSFDQGSPESFTSSNKVQDPSYNQGSVAKFPSVPGGTHSLSAQRILQNLSSSQVTLETSSSLQKDIEGSLDVHGAQQLQPHSPGYLGHSQCTPKLSETLSSPQMVLKFSESSSMTLETLLPLPGTLGHSTSAQSTLFPSDSDQQILESSSSVQKPVQFSPSSKGSLRHTPSVLEAPQSLLSAPLCPKLSLSDQEFLGSSPPQKGCSGDSLSVQRTHGTSISAQEFVGYSKSVQESPEIFTSSQEDLGPSLAQEALVHSPSILQDCGLFKSSKDTLGTSISTQGARKTPSSVQKSIVTVPSAQNVVGIQRPLGTSQFASETSEPSSEEIYSTLKSIRSSIKTLASLLEILRFLTSAKGAAGPSITDQVILRTPTVSHKALEFSPSDQQSVKSASLQIGLDRTSLTDKGLQEMSSGEKVTLQDSPLQQTCSGNALSTQGALGLSISAQEYLGHSPSVHGSPDTSLSSEEASGTRVDQGPLGPSLSLSLSDLGDLGLSEYSQGPLETSPSTHSTLEIPSSTHGIIETSPPAQDSLGHLPHSVQILQQAPLMPETLEPLSSTEEGCNISDSFPGTSETFPSTPGSLEISLSAQSTMGPSVSEKEILGPSVVSLEEFLGPSPPDQGFLRPTPSTSGTVSLSPSEQCCQEISSGVQGDSSSQQGYVGNSLHSQETLGLSTSAQESFGHSPSAQGSLDTSFSSQESLGPSLNHGPLGHSSSYPGNLGLSDSDQGTLEIPPFTLSILEISSSNNGLTETSTTSQDSLVHLPPSVQTLQPSLTPETSELLPTAKEVCKTSESVSGTQESFPSLLEALRHLNSGQCTLGPSVCDQGTLEPSTPLCDTLESSKPSQGVLEPIPSTQEGVRPFFSMEFLGLSICEHDDFIPIPSHDDCLRYSSYPNKSHRLSNPTKNIARHAPFPEGNIRYSLSDLDALRSLTSAKSRFTSSIYVRKDSSSTSPPLQRVPPPASSELNFRSRFPNKEDLRCSSSPRGDSRHSKSKKTKSRHASKESHLKSVPSEDKGLKFHHSSKKGGRASVSNKVGARLKTEPEESLTTTSAKGGCRSSRSHEECLRYSSSSQGIPRRSRSTKTKLEEASSNKADVHASHTEHEGSLLLLLLPGQDSDIPLILKKSSKLLLNPKKASGHLQMEAVLVEVSSLSQHPKTMMSNILFLQRRTLNTLFMSKRDKNLPLVPERGAGTHWVLRHISSEPGCRMHSTNSQAGYSTTTTEPELFQMDVWMKGAFDLFFSTGGSQIFPNGPDSAKDKDILNYEEELDGEAILGAYEVFHRVRTFGPDKILADPFSSSQESHRNNVIPWQLEIILEDDIPSPRSEQLNICLKRRTSLGLSCRLFGKYSDCCLTLPHIHYSGQMFEYLVKSWRLIRQFLERAPLYEVGWDLDLMSSSGYADF